MIARDTQLPHNRLIDLLNDHVALEGRMWAIKITGAFDSVTADADGRQEPPYRPEQAQKSPPLASRRRAVVPVVLSVSSSQPSHQPGCLDKGSGRSHLRSEVVVWQCATTTT